MLEQPTVMLGIDRVSEYALGAMHALVHVEPDDSQVVRGACQAAIAMDVSCGGAVEILRVECPDS